jgi:hypothetical protein
MLLALIRDSAYDSCVIVSKPCKTPLINANSITERTLTVIKFLYTHLFFQCTNVNATLKHASYGVEILIYLGKG